MDGGCARSGALGGVPLLVFLLRRSFDVRCPPDVPLALLGCWALAGAPSLGSQSVKEMPHRGMFADTLLRTGRLPNGLTYYIRENDQPSGLAELRLVVRAGSVLEDADQRGEHMAFNGTRRFRKDEIIGYLERLGMRFGAQVNAYTGPDETVYRLAVPTDTAGALKVGLWVMEDWASSIALDPAELARERGVVVEEWRTGRIGEPGQPRAPLPRDERVGASRVGRC